MSPAGLPELGALAGAALAAAAVVLLLVPPLRRLARRTGYLDHPEARKQHVRATPLLGGVAVAAGALGGSGAVLLYLRLPLPGGARWGIAAALVALVVGLVDDRFGMRPGLKLTLQALAGGLFLLGGVHPAAGAAPGPLLGLLWIVALMNAVNFLDNMDGIAGGISAVMAAALGLLLLSWGRGAEALFAFALAGASLAFLKFNFPPATIFLGDAGSLFLGAALASLSLLAADAGPGGIGWPVVLLILGYPVFDLCFVVATRALAGRRIYQGGRDHTTHRLGRLLGGPRRTALAVYACVLLLAWSGIAAAGVRSPRGIVPWIIAWAAALAILGVRLARVPVTAAAPAPRDPA